MASRIGVIGGGFAGLSSAITLADKGYEVTLFEKNETLGGRARQFQSHGFTFDMGPSWYWMPDVFEQFFSRFGKQISDYYELVRLDPSYRVVFSEDEVLDIPASLDSLKELFERIEPGAANKLGQFLKEAAYKYKVGMQDLVFKPGKNISEFANAKFLKSFLNMHVFRSMHSYVRKYFKDQRIIQILEFPVLFLGSMPEKTPALYSLMNYADMVLGTWYPKGGMHKIIEGMIQLAGELGVKFVTNTEIEKILVRNNLAQGLSAGGKNYAFDAVVGGGDYHHIEQNLISKQYRTYSPEYWDKRKLSPSSLIFFLGIEGRLDNLLHHNLFFDKPFARHAKQIYRDPEWPDEPLFYVCCPSKTDDSVAPEGHENLFVLIPLASGLTGDDEKTRDKYLKMVLDRIESRTGQPLHDKIVYKRSYAHKDFKEDYHAFKGNAYGLANTLGQTAILKPSMHSKKIKNMIFTGQLTVPGPGVPPAIISGQVAAEEIVKIVNK